MEYDLLSQAYEQFRLGRYDVAERHCRMVLARDPGHAETNHLLGAIRYHEGKLQEALAFLQRAVVSPGATAEHHNNLGCLLMTVGQKDSAIAAFRRALAINPAYTDALNNLNAMYRAPSKPAKALADLEHGAFRPELLQAMPHLGAEFHGLVPPWHFAMMADRMRNEGYEAAIRRAAPGKRVLDIGTGAGLLALMAARAGAAHVTTCEAVPLIADRARQIVRVNGLSDRITIIPRYSTEISVPDVMAEKAEMMVTETFASALINESVLPIVEHAHEHLLTSDAIVIPAAASVMGYLAGGQLLEDMLYVRKVAGFDLSAFNDFAPHMVDAGLDNMPHEVLSGDVELMRFDLRQKRFPAGGKRVAIPVTRRGVCAGIVQWIRLELDAHTKYENRPSPKTEAKRHWMHIVHRFPNLLTLAPGDVVHVLFRHDRTQIAIDLLE